nr:unnamed protein product [Callosobruchus analis]
MCVCVVCLCVSVCLCVCVCVCVCLCVCSRTTPIVTHSVCIVLDCDQTRNCDLFFVRSQFSNGFVIYGLCLV